MTAAAIQEGLPLSELQLQIWAGQQRDPDQPLYNMAIASTINGVLDPIRIAHAWAQVVQQFPDLTSIVRQCDGEIRRFVTGQAIALQTVDLSTHADPEAATNRLINEQCQEMFDVGQSLCRVMLIRQSEYSSTWFCCIHHLISDAGSFAILWQALVDAYESAGVEPVVPRLNAELAALAQSSIAPQSDEAARHWQERANPSVVDIYGSSTAPARTASRRINVPLDQRRLDGLVSAAQTTAARTFSPELSQSIVLAAIQVAFLYRITEQSEISIGLLVSNRQLSSARDLPGLHIEIIPLRIMIERNDSFSVLFNKMRAEMLSALRFTVPGVSARIAQNNLAVVLNFVPTVLGHFGSLSTTHEWLHPGHSDRQHVIRLHANRWNARDELTLAFDFNQSRLPGTLSTSALAHWLPCLDDMLAQPTKPIGRICITTPDLPAVAAPPTAAVGTTGCVLGSIVETARRHPEQTALAQGDERLTYEQLLHYSARMSLSLRALSAGPEQRVGVFLPRCLELMPAILAVLGSGATYVPIDATQPAERLKFIIDNSQLCGVITNHELSTKLPTGTQTVLVETVWAEQCARMEPDTAAGLLLTANPPADSPAYVLYTSGSTGQPKGVVVSRAAFYNYCRWAADFYDRNRALTFPLFTSIGFDLTVTSMFVPLMTGGSIRVYPESDAAAELALLDVMADDAVDIVKLTPAHLALLQGQDFSHSRVGQFVVGGEDFKRELARNIHQSFAGKVCMHNEYGPTEATVGCIVHTYDEKVDIGQSVLIGKPVAGMSAYLLNSHQQAQPQGVVGELYLAGPSLADGYWQRTDLSVEKFIDDPFVAGRKMYRTGDLARADANGNLVYLGRTDDQVKIKGVRIELGEIEAAALTHPALNQCVAGTADIQRNKVLAPERLCIRCGVSSRSPETKLDETGLCNLCTGFDKYQARAHGYFKQMADLEKLADQIKQLQSPHYDCMMLLSGGKDSTYALARLVDLGLKVLAFTLDNGYISVSAKRNIHQVCATLGVDHRFGSTEAMNEIFVDSLNRYANVCNGCFKTIYTLSMKLADEMSIPFIVTGLSRGQFFETRLTAELFTADDVDIEAIDDTVLSARKAYHRVDDAPARLLGAEAFRSDAIFEKVRFIDFYRYCPVTLQEMLDYLDVHLPWVRPTDTGRSTNCLINDVGIHVHKAERGYHNYSLPYSWDVRLGHKQRDAALDELNDDIDESYVHGVLNDLGYTPKVNNGNREERLVLYYTSTDDLAPDTLRAWLKDRLPPGMMPAYLIPLASLPLSANGKVLRSALPAPEQAEHAPRSFSPPETDIERTMAALWCQLLDIREVGRDDNFFELGGDSLLAIRFVARLNQAGVLLKAADIFEHQTIRALAPLAQDRPVPISALTPAETARFASISDTQRDRLSALLAKKRR